VSLLSAHGRGFVREGIGISSGTSCQEFPESTHLMASDAARRIEGAWVPDFLVKRAQILE
jgi:hypothetical protein